MVNIQTRIWQKTLNATGIPHSSRWVEGDADTSGQSFISLNWVAADMDAATSSRPASPRATSLTLASGCARNRPIVRHAGHAKPGQTQREGPYETGSLPRLSRYRRRGLLRHARGRRWDAFLACDAINQPIGPRTASFRAAPLPSCSKRKSSPTPEVPSFKLPRNLKADTVEGDLAVNLMRQFERTTPTFAEDKASRGHKGLRPDQHPAVYATGKVTLPSKLTIALDPPRMATTPPNAARGSWRKSPTRHPRRSCHQARHRSKPASRP